RVDDERCAALLESLRAEQPGLCVIELVDDDDAFSFSVPGSDVPARVGRHDLARTLTLALAQELDAAWPGARAPQPDRNRHDLPQPARPARQRSPRRGPHRLRLAARARARLPH